MEPALWRHLDVRHPEAGLAFNGVKQLFWGAQCSTSPMQGAYGWLRLHPDKLSDEVAHRGARRTGMVKPHREGHPEEEYDTLLVGKMERTTPQFNLRNVMRLEKEIDPEWVEWDKMSLGIDRRGYDEDLEEVRTIRWKRPEFMTLFYSSSVSYHLRNELVKVFITNDWEQWYGEDKKRAAGSMWKYFPPDGEGKRTRAWPEMVIREHRYWKGRLITEEF